MGLHLSLGCQALPLLAWLGLGGREYCRFRSAIVGGGVGALGTDQGASQLGQPHWSVPYSEFYPDSQQEP